MNQTMYPLGQIYLGFSGNQFTSLSIYQFTNLPIYQFTKYSVSPPWCTDRLSFILYLEVERRSAGF